MKLRMLYFASLREKTGIEHETIETNASSLADVYEQLNEKHRFALPFSAMRCAMNGEFVSWQQAPKENAEVAFIPPVSGG